MRIEKLQPKDIVKRKIMNYAYRIKKLSNGIFLVSKTLDGQVISQYFVELQGFCTCPDFKQRRVRSQQACKHIQMLLLALTEDPEFKQGVIHFDENLKKLL